MSGLTLFHDVKEHNATDGKSCGLIRLENISSDSNSLRNRQDGRTVYKGGLRGAETTINKYSHYSHMHDDRADWSSRRSVARPITEIYRLVQTAHNKTRQSYLIQQQTAKGTFSVRIPLKDMSEFCEDYERIVYFFKRTKIEKNS